MQEKKGSNEDWRDEHRCPEGGGLGIDALLGSHLKSGRDLEVKGHLREAIAEYSKEHARPIQSKIDAEIAQSSYWHVGIVHRLLGEPEEAIRAFQAARRLLKEHGVGVHPHNDLAEALIHLGRFEDAIEACQEELELQDNWGTRELLSRAIAMRRDALDADSVEGT
jgi:tetratricopeptide (TPR) repeat protein